jgi:hypothetical protein
MEWILFILLSGVCVDKCFVSGVICSTDTACEMKLQWCELECEVDDE